MKYRSIIIFIGFLGLYSCQNNSHTNQAELYINVSNAQGGEISVQEILPGKLNTIERAELSSFGNVRFNLPVKGEGLFQLKLPDGNGIPLCVSESDVLKLDIDLNNSEEYGIRGSEQSALLLYYNKKKQEAQNKIKAIGEAFEENKHLKNFSEIRDSLMKIYDQIVLDNKHFSDSVIRANKKSIATLLMINTRLGRNNLFTLENDLNIFETLDSALMQNKPENVHAQYHHKRISDYRKELAEEKLAMERLENGKPAPEFNLPDTSGKIYSLKNFLGEKVVLCFWASWCNPCLREVPVLKNLQKQHKNTQFVGISIDRQRVLWEQALNGAKMPWLQLCDLKAPHSPVIRAYYLKNDLPVYFVIDKDGKIVGKTTKSGELDKLLRI